MKLTAKQRRQAGFASLEAIVFGSVVVIVAIWIALEEASATVLAYFGF